MAVADHPDLIRNIDSIYESYRSLMEGNDHQLDRVTFAARLQSLKGQGCGRILMSPKMRWYRLCGLGDGYGRSGLAVTGNRWIWPFTPAFSGRSFHALRAARQSRAYDLWKHLQMHSGSPSHN